MGERIQVGIAMRPAVIRRMMAVGFLGTPAASYALQGIL